MVSEIFERRKQKREVKPKGRVPEEFWEIAVKVFLDWWVRKQRIVAEQKKKKKKRKKAFYNIAVGYKLNH